MLKCVENCGSRHPPKRVPWARCQKNFQTYFIHINFHICNICKPKSFTALLILYLFFDYLLSTFPKKWKLKNGPRLPTRLYNMIMLVILVCESLKRRTVVQNAQKAVKIRIFFFFFKLFLTVCIYLLIFIDFEKAVKRVWIFI